MNDKREIKLKKGKFLLYNEGFKAGRKYERESGWAHLAFRREALDILSKYKCGKHKKLLNYISYITPTQK